MIYCRKLINFPVRSCYSALSNARQPKSFPPSTTIGTNPAGTAFYAIGAGLVKSSAAPVRCN